MAEKRKVLVITYYWPPSGGSGVQRWMFFCKHLPDFGFEPYVITVDEKKASYKFIDESFTKKVEHVKVYRTNTLEPLSFYSKIIGGDRRQNIPQGFAGESDPSFFQRVSRFIRGNFFLPDARKGWNRFAYKKALEVIERENIDCVITTGPPHSTHLVGLKLKKKLNNIRWIADFRDPWTEVYYNRMLYKSTVAKKIDNALEAQVLNAADLILTIGPGMKKLLQKKLAPNQGDKVYFIYNGYDKEAFINLKGEKSREVFTVCHLGILSEHQPITAFLLALKQLIERVPEIGKKIKLQFVGKISPAILAEVKSVLQSIQMEVVEYIPHKKALDYMMNADLLFNSFAVAQESEIVISGKLMEYIATGNPIIGLGHPTGDAAELLKNMEYAHVFDRSEVANIASFIEKIYNNWLNKKEYKAQDIEQYSRYETTRQLAAILKKLGV